MNERLISVILPCYNAAPYVHEAISSVLRQTYTHNEIVVVDDGSIDDSTRIIKRLVDQNPDRIKLMHQEKLGPYPARNMGLRYAKGEYIAFLDADDWWREDCLEKLVKTLEDQQADLVYCGWQNVGKQAINDEPYIPPAYENIDTTAAFLRNCPWPIHAALTRKSVIDAVKGFSERFFSSMDYDLWLRILGHTRNIVRLPEVMAYYRWHGSTQISATKWRQVLDAVQVRRDFISSFPDLTSHLSSDTLAELVDGILIKEAYRSYWKRDLLGSQKLFRDAFRRRAWHMNDLKYIIPALLPAILYQGLVSLSDNTRGRKV